MQANPVWDLETLSSDDGETVDPYLLAASLEPEPPVCYLAPLQQAIERSVALLRAPEIRRLTFVCSGLALSLAECRANWQRQQAAYQQLNLGVAEAAEDLRRHHEGVYSLTTEQFWRAHYLLIDFTIRIRAVGIQLYEYGFLIFRNGR